MYAVINQKKDSVASIGELGGCYALAPPHSCSSRAEKRAMLLATLYKELMQQQKSQTLFLLHAAKSRQDRKEVQHL
jgi:hypothetical protein